MIQHKVFRYHIKIVHYGAFSRFHPLRAFTADRCSYCIAHGSRSPVSRIVGIFCAAASFCDRADCWFSCGSGGLCNCHCAYYEEYYLLAAKWCGRSGPCRVVSIRMYCAGCAGACGASNSVATESCTVRSTDS